MRKYNTSTLGLTTQRNATQLKPGTAYTKFFSAPTGKVTIKSENASVFDTIAQIKKLIPKYAPQTAQLAQKLVGTTLQQTCANIEAFMQDHIAYHEDGKYAPNHPNYNKLQGAEELHSPNKIWQLRTRGVDCDDFTILGGTLLYNLNIPFIIRMTKYTADWQHVYLVVPTNPTNQPTNNGKAYYTIDPVVQGINYEKPFTDKYDTPMNGAPTLGFAEETNFKIPNSTQNQSIDLINTNPSGGQANQSNNTALLNNKGGGASTPTAFTYLPKIFRWDYKAATNEILLIVNQPFVGSDSLINQYNQLISEVKKQMNLPANNQNALKNLANPFACVIEVNHCQNTTYNGLYVLTKIVKNTSTYTFHLANSGFYLRPNTHNGQYFGKTLKATNITPTAGGYVTQVLSTNAFSDHWGYKPNLVSTRGYIYKDGRTDPFNGHNLVKNQLKLIKDKGVQGWIASQDDLSLIQYIVSSTHLTHAQKLKLAKYIIPLYRMVSPHVIQAKDHFIKPLLPYSKAGLANMDVFLAKGKNLDWVQALKNPSANLKADLSFLSSEEINFISTIFTSLAANTSKIAAWYKDNEIDRHLQKSPKTPAQFLFDYYAWAYLQQDPETRTITKGPAEPGANKRVLSSIFYYLYFGKITADEAWQILRAPFNSTDHEYKGQLQRALTDVTDAKLWFTKTWNEVWGKDRGAGGGKLIFNRFKNYGKGSNNEARTRLLNLAKQLDPVLKKRYGGTVNAFAIRQNEPLLQQVEARLSEIIDMYTKAYENHKINTLNRTGWAFAGIGFMRAAYSNNWGGMASRLWLGMMPYTEWKNKFATVLPFSKYVERIYRTNNYKHIAASIVGFDVHNELRNPVINGRTKGKKAEFQGIKFDENSGKSSLAGLGNPENNQLEKIYQTAAQQAQNALNNSSAELPVFNPIKAAINGLGEGASAAAIAASVAACLGTLASAYVSIKQMDNDTKTSTNPQDSKQSTDTQQTILQKWKQEGHFKNTSLLVLQGEVKKLYCSGVKNAALELINTAIDKFNAEHQRYEAEKIKYDEGSADYAKYADQAVQFLALVTRLTKLTEFTNKLNQSHCATSTPGGGGGSDDGLDDGNSKPTPPMDKTTNAALKIGGIALLGGLLLKVFGGNKPKLGKAPNNTPPDKNIKPKAAKITAASKKESKTKSASTRQSAKKVLNITV